MFDNIGKKIKGLAKFFFALGVIVTVIAGISNIALGADSWEGEYLIAIGIIYIVLGPIIAWAASFVLYGFGELIDKTCDIERNTRALRSAEAQLKAENSAPDENAKEETEQEKIP